MPDSDLAVMRRIDELHLLHPFAGSWVLRDLLRQEGVSVGRLHVATLMKRMRIGAIYRRPNTSKPSPGHKFYPYLLRKLAVTQPNQVWATDITCIPMARGFVYLVAIVDWFTRRVLAWRVSISLDTGFCIEALEEALGRHGKPAIVNSDRGLQFTSTAFTAVLLREKIAISMDGKGCWRDNVFHRAPLALGEIRGGLPQRLRLGPRGPRRHQSILRVYNADAAQRRGAGRLVYEALVDTLTVQGFTQAVARIALPS